MTTVKDIDIAVFGATGFTGQLIAEYLGQQDGVKVAIAGRNGDKLTKVKSDLGLSEDTETIVADASDKSALTELARRAQVVIAAAGPYQHYGENLIAACAEEGTDYLDLCGESNWIRAMIDKYDATAKASGARIINSSGFDSIPSDLGILHLQNLAAKHQKQPFTRVKGRVEAMQGVASGGTVASIMAEMGVAAQDPAVAELIGSPYALAPGFAGPEQPDGDSVKFDEDLNSWAAPFIMAAINTKTVHRSNFLQSHRYGTDFGYDEMTMTGPGDEGKELATQMADPGAMLNPEGGPPQPGEGPSPEEREAGHFTIAYHGTNSADQYGLVRVSGFQDPGYGCTSKMISQAALCLLKDDVETAGGFWTPATGLGEKLVDRLGDTGVLKFETEVSTNS
ncbi:saccharopine dehydrogenase NADP-binding domain-containing protein [Parasphingorhabdus litoris]|uniref:Saccharopine dehydrogenase NADP-binding domain-containing protein n=1 Tax=Parasphingorhabdus litoris TaxID=394733 RepID=A0ABN1AIK0_9SPHN|nr:saccharopine dehydrogenase NADP-binding domain-containing protein [Parasphingorhabdus litoris]